MSREIKVFNQETNQSITLQSEATCWSELRNEINASGTINASGKTPIVRETKITLGFDDSALPSDAFTLFLFPVKVKSGTAKKVPSVKKAIKSISTPVLKKQTLSSKEIESMIKDASKRVATAITASTGTLKKRIEEEFAMVKKASDKILASEAAKIKKELGLK
jgi:hypothetical protein